MLAGQGSRHMHCSRKASHQEPASAWLPLRLQTDGCLRQLAARLRGMGADDVLAAPGAAGGSSDGGGLAALEQSHEAWNRLAAAFQADLPHQPKLLTGTSGAS